MSDAADRAADERVIRAMAEGYRRALTETEVPKFLRETFPTYSERERRLVIMAWVIALTSRDILTEVVGDLGEEGVLASFTVRTLQTFARVNA